MDMQTEDLTGIRIWQHPQRLSDGELRCIVQVSRSVGRTAPMLGVWLADWASAELARRATDSALDEPAEPKLALLNATAWPGSELRAALAASFILYQVLGPSRPALGEWLCELHATLIAFCGSRLTDERNKHGN